MKVRDFCTSEVVTVEPGASLREASILMRNHHVGTLVVLEPGGGRRPTGILTDRDIVVAVIAVPGARPEGIRVGDAMSANVALAREDDGVFEAAQVMADRGVRRLPVVGEDGALRGIVSADDIQRVVSDELAHLSAALKRGGELERVQRRVLDVLSRGG